MKVASLVLATVAVSSLLWLAGEQHRQNCIREMRVDCSVLPWENGKTPPPSEVLPDLGP